MTQEEINAAANAAWHARTDDQEWVVFDHARDAYETGFADGYRAALAKCPAQP